MWVIPDTYQPSWLSVRDMLESKEDLTLLESSIESSLMWRSKPSPLRTWSQRWSRVSWIPHLFTRILKPSRGTFFEGQLISSLEDIRASRSQQLGYDLEKTTRGISGRSSTTASPSSILEGYFSRTSKDTSRLDSPQSSAIWKNEVTTRRGEYSVRLKLGPLNRENESTLWPSASARDWKATPGQSQTGVNPDGSERKRIDQLARVVYADPQTRPTPEAHDAKQHCSNPDMAMARKKSGKQVGLETAAHLVSHSEQFPSPDVGAAKGRGMTSASGRSRLGGALNPTWVEWLMGVPTGWTELGSWETE